MKCMPYSFAEIYLQQEDDIDRLFQKLQPIEPPAEVVARILSHIKRLPRPAELPSLAQQPSQKELPTNKESTQNGLVVHNENQMPS
jgi:hypothetical protein